MNSQRAGRPRLLGEGRWAAHLMLAVLVIAQVLCCHLVLTDTSPAASPTISSQHDIGHETCEPGVAVAAPAVRSVGRECSVPFEAGDVLAAVALLALVGGVAFANGSPRWAPRVPAGGRVLLTRLQVIRV